MTLLAGLLQSYLDLRWHFDPAAASAAGVVSADGRLGAFDAQAMREHLAAFRSVAGAIEDLELEELDDEIDRTALLGDVRTAIARFEQDRPHVRDPGFWLLHAREAIASLLLRAPADELAPAASARVMALPALLEAGRATLRRPPLLLVDAALAQLGPLGELLVQAAARFGSAAPGGPAAMNASVAAALEALTRFGTALRDEIEPEADWTRAALGEAAFGRRIQEPTRSGPARPSWPAGVPRSSRQRRGTPARRSETRRRPAGPGWSMRSRPPSRRSRPPCAGRFARRWRSRGGRSTPSARARSPIRIGTSGCAGQPRASRRTSGSTPAA